MTGEFSRDDPFAPSSDPYLDDEREPPAARESPGTATISRRGVLKGLTVLSAAGIIQGCVPHRLGCLPKPTNPEECQHRFCRYYRG